MDDKFYIRELREEIDRLRLAANNIERLLTIAEQNIEAVDTQVPINRRTATYPFTHPVVRDIDGREILIGDRVEFVTRGAYSSTSGIVYKVTPSGTRVMVRDHLRRPISRAPHNLRILLE